MSQPATYWPTYGTLAQMAQTTVAPPDCKLKEDARP
jgi:hypothetical protein